LLGGNRILKSIDYGENWLDVYINNPDSQDYSFDGFDLDFLNNELGWVVGEFHSAGWDTNGACILETSDGGENWRRVWDNGITEWNNYCLNSITVSDSTAWAVGNHGLIVKYTLKDKWQLQTSVTGLQLNKVFFSYEQHGWIAGGSYYWGEEFQSILLKTVDGGKSWKEKQFEKEIIHDMYFADSLHGWAVGEDTTQSYLRHNSGIILESFDGGENWMPVVENLSAPLKSIHFKDGYGWAVGDNGLILRTEGFTWIDQASKDQFPLKFSLSQNYPNPFNPSTIIEFTLPKSEFVTLKIFNILGEEVVTLVNKKLQAGNHTYQFDGSKFASGIYMYMIEAGEYQQVRKMILLK
jgi:photosystem II stability/assembly factor-like uncharacterized protein